MKHRSARLILIGGHEDRTGEKVILKEVARRVGAGKLVVTTVASQEPDGLFADYQRAFRELGVPEVVELPIAERDKARQDDSVQRIQGATGVFFTGGDQLKITSQIGDTPTFRCIQELARRGGVLAGTSAGASVVCETMLVSGASEESPKVRDSVQMAPGLALVQGLVIDQHFAERGRMGRLLGAVAQNPKNLGIGIDENTAIVVEDERLEVIGTGSVYVVDGADITWSNVAEAAADCNLALHDVRLHVLSTGDRFDLRRRRPMHPRPAERKGEQRAETDGKKGKSDDRELSCLRLGPPRPPLGGQ